MSPRSLLLASFSVLAACSKPQVQPDAAPAASASVKHAPTAAPAATHREPRAGDIPAPGDVAHAPADAARTPSGLATKVLTKGTGAKHPAPEDRVKVHYTGWTSDGVMFDSSVLRGDPASFAVGGVIKGWTEALQLMVVNEKRRVWIPAALAYGDHARAGAPTGDLTFEIELLEIVEAPKPIPAPADVKEAPKDAKKTASGLAYKVLKPGKGASPKLQDTVTVHYTGWTTDGKMFDSSVQRGEPTSFGLDRVIKGWTEGVQLMKVGDKARFWIPGALAYGDKPARPGAPAGTLVFDIELISITEAKGAPDAKPAASAKPAGADKKK
ncbi:MAG: FKBP-type peptidyl-prolyl cis-trans isomerase [Polyangiaceae bacterium]|nr:FKBP-type peptidyl-prolyl cis-trans isomerase [Polyangiaceae bacterium]